MPDLPDHSAPAYGDVPSFKYAGFRMLASEVDALADWARFHGRSLDAELKLALRMHLRLHALNALRLDPEGIAARGYDVDADRAQFRAELDQLQASAFSSPIPGLAPWL